MFMCSCVGITKGFWCNSTRSDGVSVRSLFEQSRIQAECRSDTSDPSDGLTAQNSIRTKRMMLCPSFDVVAWCSFPPAGDKTEAIWRRRRHRPSQSVSVEARLWRVCASCSVYVTGDYLTWWKLRVRIFFQFPRVFGFHLKRFEWPNLRVSRRESFVWKPEICQSFSL